MILVVLFAFFFSPLTPNANSNVKPHAQVSPFSAA